MNRFVCHPLLPVYDKCSKILILGTMPSPKSRENGFYYSHPQNKFWRIICELLNYPLVSTPDEKKALLLKSNIALWDVLKSCNIVGADDSSIKNPKVNDINIILNNANIKAVFTTGAKSTALYKKYIYPETNVSSIYLPSTSPANCRIPYEKIKDEYKVILEFLK